MEQTPDQMVARVEALESTVIALIRALKTDNIPDAVVKDLRMRSEHMPRESAMFQAFDTLATNLR